MATVLYTFRKVYQRKVYQRCGKTLVPIRWPTSDRTHPVGSSNHHRQRQPCPCSAAANSTGSSHQSSRREPLQDAAQWPEQGRQAVPCPLAQGKTGGILARAAATPAASCRGVRGAAAPHTAGVKGAASPHRAGGKGGRQPPHSGGEGGSKPPIPGRRSLPRPCAGVEGAAAPLWSEAQRSEHGVGQPRKAV